MKENGVLLLGGAGFIGSALARKLAEAGRQVIVLAPHPPRDARDLDYVQGNLGDPGRLAKVLPRCSTVVHLASATTPGSSTNSPALELDNLAPTLRLLEALEARPQSHLVFFSSGGTVYGNPQRLPVHEDAPSKPRSFHGAGKLAQEAFLQAFRARGHAVTVLRPSNVYGPEQTLKSGFGLIRTLLEHVRRGTSFEVWGDGESVRDYIYIDDVTEACARLIAMPEDNDTYNLGSGIGHSINQVRDIVEKVTGQCAASTCATSFSTIRGLDRRCRGNRKRRYLRVYGGRGNTWQIHHEFTTDGFDLHCQLQRHGYH